MNDHLLVSSNKGIVTIWLNRPDSRNALQSTMLADLDTLLREWGEEKSTRVIVLRGKGSAFCAGADLKEIQSLDNVMAQREYFNGIARVLKTMSSLPQPVIAGVHGYVLAGGLGLAVGADFTLASEDAVFGLPEIFIGLFPMVVMAPITRAAGRKKAMELLFTGERISAEQAEQMGLITRVVKDLDAEIDALAQKLVSKSPTVLKLGKEAFYTVEGMQYEQAMRYLREMIAITASTPDAKEGIEAFLEKRPPKWSE